MFMDGTRIWSLWKWNQRYLCSGARPCVSLPGLPVTSVRQSGIGVSPKWLQSDLNCWWTHALACLYGIFRPPPGLVGSRSFPTLRWNTDFSGYKNLWNFEASRQLCIVRCTCQQSFWGRIVVFSVDPHVIRSNICKPKKLSPSVHRDLVGNESNRNAMNSGTFPLYFT